MTEYCINCYIDFCSKSKKVRKFCLNLSLRLPVLRSIIKKLGGVCVHRLQADLIIDESTSAMLWFRIMLLRLMLSLILNNMN